jgi:hypothetical protein
VVADVESYSRSDFVASILSELRDRGYTEAKVDGESFCVGTGAARQILLLGALHGDLEDMPADERAGSFASDSTPRLSRRPRHGMTRAHCCGPSSGRPASPPA